MIRLYRPHEEILDGSYQFPDTEPVGASQASRETPPSDVVPVTWENFPRAQFELFWKDFIAERGGFGELHHNRTLTPVEEQEAMPRQPNRDTLYSLGLFDLSEPLTVVKPDSGDRYQSIEVDNQDQYQKRVLHAPGEYTVTRDEIGTRYVALGVRTFVDPTDPEDLQSAQTLQDEISVHQDSTGTFETANWDRQSFDELQTALATVGRTMEDLRGAYGDVGEVDPVKRLLASAVYKWGGLAESEAFYLTRTPEQNDGETPHTLTVRDVPVDGFWSVTVYNRDWYLEENEYDAYSVNDVTAERNDDGSVTIHFGGDPDQPNFLYTPEEWNYVVRLYRPHEEILDGRYLFPTAEVTG
ncbi:DUF1214 domain-containing protein [Halobellus sp. Atlit-31R]|nr:DUF1214 domain-containing protein [Halobellus sp. Atlit-31R]